MSPQLTREGKWRSWSMADVESTRRRRKMRMAAIVACVLAFAGCRTPLYVTNWRYIELGMTHNEVFALLGEPHAATAPLEVDVGRTGSICQTNLPRSLVRQAEFISGTNFQHAFDEAAKALVRSMFDRNYERWIYGRDSFIGPPEKGFAVYFDDGRKVIGYRRPTKGRYRNLPKADSRPEAGKHSDPTEWGI